MPQAGIRRRLRWHLGASSGPLRRLTRNLMAAAEPVHPGATSFPPPPDLVRPNRHLHRRVPLRTVPCTAMEANMNAPVSPDILGDPWSTPIDQIDVSDSRLF